MKFNLYKKVLILFSILFFLCCFFLVFPGFTNHANFWPVNLLGLGFPFVFLFTLIICFLLALKKSKWFFLSLTGLLLVYNQITVLFAFNLPASFNSVKEPVTIRILSWNVSRWDERNKQKRGGTSYRGLMMDYIEASGADVVCLQEFFECHEPKWFEANLPELKKRGYPYHFFSPSSMLQEGKLQYGLCIVSKHPITDTGTALVTKGLHSEGLMYADIQFPDTTVRIFNANLESAGINKDDYRGEGNIKLSRTVVTKIKNSYQLRNTQAAQCAEAIKKSENPSVICADLDDVPNSYAYFTIRDHKQDAFLKKGSGLGRTFNFISPTLRIDYIFSDSFFQVLQFNVEKLPYSDHYPVIADFKLKTQKAN